MRHCTLAGRVSGGDHRERASGAGSHREVRRRNRLSGGLRVAPVLMRQELGATLIEFTPHYRHESYLHTVLAEYNGQYVCWIYNEGVGAFVWGHYGTSARQAYDKRVRRD